MTEKKLPATAQKLVDHALSHGWRVQHQWQTNHWDETFVHILVSRWASEEELKAFREDHRWGDHWEFSLTWHSRNAAQPGGLRLFGRVLGRTPEVPQNAEYNLTDVREIIAAYPELGKYETNGDDAT